MTESRDNSYLAAADLLRVLAVFLIGCFHIWQQSWLTPGLRLPGRWVDFTPWVRRGYMMVDLMLLLSGFLLFLPWARCARAGRPLPETRVFYKKRLARIVPSYLAAILLCLVNALVCGRNPGSDPLWKDLLLHLTFTHTFSRGAYVWTSLDVALWTVAVEMQFYLLFPLLGRWFARRPGLTAGGMAALGLLCRVSLLRVPDITVYFNQLPCMMDVYAAGMLAAWLASGWKKPWNGWVCAALSLSFLAAVFRILQIQNPADNRELNQLQMLWRLPLALAGGGFLFFGCFWPSGLNRALGGRVLRFLSGISYNFYIWHQFLAVKLKEWHLPDYVTEMPQRDEGLLWQRKYTALCFTAGLLAAVLGTYLIEKPGARLLLKKEKRAGR